MRFPTGNRVPMLEEETLKAMIRNLYEVKNQGRAQPQPLTNKDFVEARNKKMEFNGQRYPAKSAFMNRIGGGTLAKACARLNVPFRTKS